MKISRISRKLSCVLILLLAVTALGAPAALADYPERTIEVIVGWGAGGGSDLFARTIVKEVEKILNTNMVVINMPGASSAEAANYVMKQPADGYTVFSVTSDILMNPCLGRTEYDFDSFTPILRAHVDTGMLHTYSGSEFGNWEDVVAYAKNNPGDIKIGVTGSASFDEIATAIILDSAGIDATMVPFESSGEMHAALLGGHLDLMYDEPAPVMSLVEAEKVVPLIVASEERLEIFPDVPTVLEFGYDMPPGMWRGMVVKAGTPEEIVKTLEAAFKEATETPTYKEFEESRLLNLRAGYLGTEGFAKVMEEESGLYKRVMEQLGYIKK